MIEFGVTLCLVVAAGFLIALIEPAREIGNAIVRLLDGIEQHRRAQATGVMKHAGLLEFDTDED